MVLNVIGDPALRKALELDGVAAAEHPQRIEALKERLPHTIQYVNGDHVATCASYAFRLSEDSVYRAVARGSEPNIFAGLKFVEWALAGRLRPIDDPQIGSLAMYFMGEKWRHVGLVYRSGRIISKWGTYPVYEHEISDIPASYGNRVRFYERPAPPDALALFLEYARFVGMADADIASCCRGGP
jgi:hypothetical protein